jgi:hypothetical protein
MWFLQFSRVVLLSTAYFTMKMLHQYSSGAGYPSCLTISDSLNSEKEKKTLLQCLISSYRLSDRFNRFRITGIDKKRQEIKIIKAGKFQI